MSDPKEWVTVAEAARQLGIDQRQARRYADRLKDTDRTPPDISPVSVKMSAMVSARKASLERSLKQKSAERVPTDTDRTEHGQSAVSPQDSPPNVSASMLEMLKEQITVKDSQLAERDAQIRALLRIVDEDRTEIRKLQAQLAIAPGLDPEAAPVENPQEPPPAPRTAVQKRTWWEKLVDIFLDR